MIWLAVMVVAVTSGAHAQITAQTSVAPELRECYLNATLVNRNNLPPVTMAVLIDIIQKIEDQPNVNVDLRQLAVLLLHTYRQDGIEFHQPEISGTSSNVLPYAPTFHSFHRHRLLLTRIIPNNLQILANDTVSSDLKCVLHHMLSTTVDARLRGDESSCNQLSQYRAARVTRQTHTLSDDVEILDPSLLNHGKNGQIKQYNPNDDVEYSNYGTKYERQLLGNSQCPLLGGVVSTTWGTVSGGHLIAGIAAGAQAQQVPILELTKSSSLNYPNVQQTVTAIYPATLSGDLAEAALIQGTERGSASISVGTAGNWNTTGANRFYMLHSRVNLEMTDPEIRGDIDGFVLGTALSSILGAYSSLKLSQLLDMYYSPRNGVFNPALRACSRRELSNQYIDANTLASETYAFAAALDTNIPLRGTITGGLDQLVNSAVTNFQSYVTSNMNSDLNCVTTENLLPDYRFRTNLYIALDFAWQFQAVYPAIFYLLDYIEVGKYGSSVTLLNAFDGAIIVNKTFSQADFHTGYTQARHQSMALNGVNLETSLTRIRQIMHGELENERNMNYVGGNATVLLYLISSNVQNNLQVLEQARILNETVPDLRIIFATSSNQFDNLWNLVRNFNDIITVALNTAGMNVEQAIAPVVNIIRQVNRRVINPLCGANYTSDTLSGQRHFEDFVEPGYTNFYSVHPNYFYVNNDLRRVRVIRTSSGGGGLVICHSRRVIQPRQNSSLFGDDESAVTCQTLAANGNVEISLQNACSDYWTINSCPPLYFSVQSSIANAAASTAICTDNACRFPYNIRFQVQIEELGCFSSASGYGAKFAFIIAALSVNGIRWF